jgi:TonB family protein
MCRFKIVTAVAVLLLCFGMLQSARSQESNGVAPRPIATTPSYPESPDGLKSFIEDMFGALKSGDQGSLSPYLSNLAIPDHGTWFKKIFGAEEGRRLEAKYEELLPQMPKKVSQILKYALDGRRTDVKVTLLQKPVDPKARLARAVTEAMIEPIPQYTVSGSSPSEKFGAYLGDFVYVDGAFRFMDTEVYQALSTAPPPRIRQGGNLTVASIIHKTAPIYPDEARVNRIQGTVVLHVVIGIEGMVIESEAVSGDPLLVNAATAAVRQWKYKPTLLNGRPVEVDTTVTLDFHL